MGWFKRSSTQLSALCYHWNKTTVKHDQPNVSLRNGSNAKGMKGLYQRHGFIYRYRQRHRFCTIQQYVQCNPMVTFIHNDKKIKGAAHKNVDVDGTCK